MDIYLDDFHLHSTSQTLHTVVKRPIQGLEGGEPRVMVYDNPGQAGQTVSQIYPGASLITLPGSLRSISGNNDQERFNDYAAARQALQQAIKFEYNTAGRILPRTLRITMPDGSAYQATVYRHNWSAPVEWNTYGTWLLELLNPSGVIESQDLTSLTVTLPQPGGVVYPVVYPIVYGASSGGSVTATNYGDALAMPVITLYGPMENPIIANQTLGKFLRLNLSLASGDIVVVTMATPSIVQGTVTNPPSTNRMGSKAAGSSFWGIAPGNNVITLRATSYDLGYATIAFRSAWGGL